MLRVGYAEVIFIQPDGKLDTMWRDAWQRLASSYPTSRWDVAVTNGHCSSTVLPLTRPETQTCSVTTFSSLSQTFYLRIAWIWTRLTCHLGCSSADGLPSSTFLLSWQNEESDCQKHGRNYHMAQSLPIRHFYHLFLFTVNVIRQMAPLFSKTDSIKLWNDVQNEESVIYAKFGKFLKL